MLSRKLIITLSCCLSFISLYSQELKHYQIDTKAKRVSFFDRIASIELMRLEETEESLLGTVERYFATPDGIGLIEYETKSIVFFNQEGDFVGAFNRFGQGPEEYQNHGAPWYKDGAIEVYDWIGRKMLSYSMQGVHNGSRKPQFDARPVSVTPYEDGYVMVTIGESPRDTIAGYELLFLDSELHIKNKAFYRKRPHPFPINLGPAFIRQNGRLFFKKRLTDSLFIIEKNKAIPFMKFDFAEEWAWNDLESTTRLKTASDMIFKTDKVFEVFAQVGEDFVDVLYYRNVPDKFRGFINRRTGEFRHYDLRRTKEKNFNLIPLKWEEDWLVHSLDSDELEAFVDKLQGKPLKFRGDYSLDDIIQSENPVLVYIKFKPL